MGNNYEKLAFANDVRRFAGLIKRGLVDRDSLNKQMVEGKWFVNRPMPKNQEKLFENGLKPKNIMPSRLHTISPTNNLINKKRKKK